MTDPISAAALALQAVEFVRGFIERGGKQGDVILQVGHGFLTYGDPPQEIGELAIHWHATNDGDGVIVIESAGLTLDSGATAMMPRAMWWMFPRRLTRGEKQSAWVELPQLLNALKETGRLDLPKYAWFKDSAGREYRRKVLGETRKTVENFWSPN
jgi:hypothetical protein